MKTKILFALVASLAIVSGCSTTIGRLNPHPNVALVSQQRTLQVRVEPAIADRFDVDAAGRTVHVQAWRATLENGFRNGFGAWFAEADGGAADLVLQIDEAKLEIGDFEPGRARIRWAATLRTRDGAVRRASGVSTRPAPAFEGGVASVGELVARDVSASIDAMYEQIAKELFAPFHGDTPA